MKFWRSSKIKVLDKHYNENPLQKSHKQLIYQYLVNNSA